MSYSVSIANQAYVYCTNIKREYTLDVSFWTQSRIKVECFVRIISVSASYIISLWSQSRIKLEFMVRILSLSTRWMSHLGLNNRQ